MIQDNSIAAANEQLARQINQQARQDPKSPYAGKLVGIANACFKFLNRFHYGNFGDPDSFGLQ